MYYSTQLESLYLRGLLEKDPSLNLKLSDSDPLVRQDLGDEARAVLAASGAQGSIYPVGYSFGSGPVIELANDVALRPRIKELVLLSPYVHAAEQLPFGGGGIESMIRLNPFFGEVGLQNMRKQSARTAAARAIDDYVNKIGRLPEGVTRETAIHGVYSQIMSVMNFDLRTVSSLSVPVRFVQAENEGVLMRAAQLEAYSAMKRTATLPVELTTVPKTTHHMLAYEAELGTDALLSIVRPVPRSRGPRVAN